MSNTLLAQYKTKFTKALEFIADDLRLTEDEVQELLTWMARTTRSRLFRPVQYSEATQPKDAPDENSFEHVFIPELDDLNTKRPKEKKNEIAILAVTDTRSKIGAGTEKRKHPETKPTSVARKVVGSTKPAGSTKSSVPKLTGISAQQPVKKDQAADKTKKASIASKTSVPATKTAPIKQIPARPGLKSIPATSKSSKSKN